MAGIDFATSVGCGGSRAFSLSFCQIFQNGFPRITIPSIESFWDLAYRNGDHLQHWESPHPPQELAALVAAGVVPAGATALDVGCGAGAEAIFLARLGFRSIGVDSSPAALEIARARAADAGVAVDFRLADVTELPLAGGTVDFAMDRGCFHVVDRDRRVDYARELHRVLRPAARFLLCGAAADDEEEGVIAIDAAEIDRVFIPLGFSRGPLVPLAMVAASGVLAGNLAVLARRP